MCGHEPRRALKRRCADAGLSIIELMVGVAIGLLVAMASVSSANIFNAMQRQGMSSGGAAVNSASALSALKNDATSAGLGFFGEGTYLCNTLNLSVGTTLHSNGASFSPVRITTATAGDQIDVVFANQIAAGSTVLLNGTSTGATAELRSLLPVAVNQAVLLAPDTPGNACLVRTVTAVTPSTATARQQLTFASTGRHNGGTFTTNPLFLDRSRVTLLGDLVWRRYRLNGTNLVLEQPFDGTSAVLARNVVGFRAEYGTAAAAAGSTTLETWQPATGTTFATLTQVGLPRVRAIRVGMVTRSPQREKPDAAGVCQASTDKPVLFGAVAEPDVADWRCFRYRTAVVVVPLRNLVLGYTPP